MEIRDVWHSLKLAIKNWLVGAAIIFILSSTYPEIFGPLLVVLTLQSMRIYWVNASYKIDNGAFVFPRSDIENSLSQIIFGARYWNLMRKKTVDLSDIENIYLDTKRWTSATKKQVGNYKDGKQRYGTVTKKHVRYSINITGGFGSANLSFLDRQKRDEVRSALQSAVKDLTGRNIDRKTAEFN